MSLTEFAALLERELQLRAVAFSRGELLAFVEAVWPLIEDDPDEARWARAFVEATRPCRRRA
jgi:hypothetical protein